MQTNALIQLGRACVRLIEAADILIATPLDQQDMIDLQAARECVRRRLRQIVTEVDPALTAQIMAASEKVLGPLHDICPN